MKSKIPLLIIIILILLVSNVVLAVEDLDSLSKAIDANSSIGDKLGDTGKTVLHGMSKSFFDFVRYVVISGILIYLFMLFIEFGNAGDNPNLVANIKSKALWLVVGLVLALNFWSLYAGATSIFSKINLI